MYQTNGNHYQGKHVKYSATGGKPASYRASYRARIAKKPEPAVGMGGMVRLVICGVIFVGLVAGKFLFPQTISSFAQSAERLIGQDADFQAAFAAVGRAISGEESARNSLQEAYVAVFNPTHEPSAAVDNMSAKSVQASARYFEPELQFLQRTESRLPEPQDVPMQEISLDMASLNTVSLDGAGENGQMEEGVKTIASAYNSPAMPENASLEQRNLGFEYQSPLTGTLSSSFGWRDHPISGGNKFHYGVDLAAETGTDIHAFANGTVYATGESSTLGKYIMIQHEGGYMTLYAHCSEVTVTGGTVDKGDKIAEVGDTGQTTGPHLHFELHDGALYLNPIYYVEVA